MGHICKCNALWPLCNSFFQKLLGDADDQMCNKCGTLMTAKEIDCLENEWVVIFFLLLSNMEQAPIHRKRDRGLLT